MSRKRGLSRGARAQLKAERRARRRQAAEMRDQAWRAANRWPEEISKFLIVRSDQSATETSARTTQLTLAFVDEHWIASAITPAVEQRAGRSARAQRRAAGVFELLDAVVPRRLRVEEIGDALEYVNAPGRTALQIYLKAIATTFWVLLNAFREIRSSVGKRAQE